MAQQPNVATPSAAVEDMRPDWELAEALLGGTREMREAGETYLPRWPNEEQADYERRKATAVLFPAYKRTVETLAAKPFSKPVTIGEDVPADFLPWLQDIDMEGRDLHTFAAGLMEDCLGYGLTGILVDYPDASSALPAGQATLADERAAGLRPYWVHIEADQILGWRAVRRGGAWVLEQLRLMEEVEEPQGEFGTICVEQVRVLEPGRWRTYRKAKDKPKDWVLHKEGVTTIPVVPFVPCYGKRDGFMTACPPLIEVAHLNVAHWQSASDQQTILHVARVPILTVSGVQDGIGPSGEAIPWTFNIGASAAVKLPQGGTMEFVEHTGAAIDAGAKDLEALEERMRQAGAELLVIAPGKVTATQVATENAVGMCALQRITLGLEDALDQALELTAMWVGRPGEGGHVTLFNDYGAATLQEASAQLLLDANQAGKLSDQTLHGELQRRGILAADVSWQDEQDRIDAQGPALGMMQPPTNGNGQSAAGG